MFLFLILPCLGFFSTTEKKGADRSQFQKIKSGMSKGEVEEILGKGIDLPYLNGVVLYLSTHIKMRWWPLPCTQNTLILRLEYANDCLINVNIYEGHEYKSKVSETEDPKHELQK